MILNAPQATYQEVVTNLTGHINSITELAQSTPTTTYVVRVGQHIYFHMDGRLDANLAGIESAATFDSEYAAEIVAKACCNRLGERGQAVKAHQTYQVEIEHLIDMRDLISKTSQQGAAA